MVASVLFQPTSVDEEYHLTTVKHVSHSSSALRFDTEDDDNDDDDDDDDDATIHYDNTTTAAAAASTLTRQQQQQQHQRVLLEEQRILQTSPSSVVPSNVPEIVLGTTFSTIRHDVTTTTTTSNNNVSFITTASIDATLPLSIPTLTKNQNCNRSFVPAVGRNTNTTVTTNASSPLSSPITPCSTTTAAIIQKPFFIMDFLEDIDPNVLVLVQESLLPPTKRKQQHHHHLPSPIPPPTGPSQDCPSFVSKDDTFGATTSNGSQALLLHGETSNGGVDSMSNRWIQLLSEHKHTSVSTLLSLPFLQRSVEMGRQYQLRGSMAAQQGQWNRALRYWWDALEIRTQIQSSVATTNRVHDPNNMDPNNRNTTSPFSVSLLVSNLDVAETYHNIGIAHGKLKQYDTALYYLHQAFEIRIDSVVAATTVSWDSDGDANTFVSSSTTTTTTNTSSTTNMQQQLHIDIVSSLRSIGNMYQSQNELSLAIQYYIKCKLLQEELLPWTRATMIDMARTCITIGHSYAMGLAYADAYEAYHDAVTIFHELGLSSSTSERNIENDHYYSEYQSTVINLRLMEQKKSF